MDAYEASIFLQAQACMVRVAGMQAENQHRQSNGMSVAYGEDAFEEQAKSIDWFAGVLHTRGTPSCYTG
jgi:hypothetical protein